MPPRTSLQGSFAVANDQNEVVCPLKNNDGTLCRKRCFGEKRFRSMQEHIRRAHPDYYISKLPATEESFNLMVTTDPKDRPQNQTTPQQYGTSNFMQDPSAFYDHSAAAGSQHMGHADHLRRPSFAGAAALAQLHNSRPHDADWDADRDAFHDTENEPHFPNYFAGADAQNMFSAGPHSALTDPSRAGNLLPADFPPGTSPRGTNSQLYSRHKSNRPRKSSVVENARKPKHERQRSKDEKRLSSGRKIGSLGPGNKWEDLLDAAASATEEESRDLTPMPPSPRGSMPPYQGQNHNQYHSYNTSPLGQSILQHSPDDQGPDAAFGEPSLEAFPSVESSDYSQVNPQSAYQHQHNSSADSSLSNAFGYHPRGHQPQSSSSSNFPIPQSGLSTSPNDLSSTAVSYGRQLHSHSYSQPSFPTQTHPGMMQQSPTQQVQHYCAACHKITPVQQSFACTECICGICRECAEVLINMAERSGSRCPKCNVGLKFKPIMLDLRVI